jgi:hypothetical protein
MRTMKLVINDMTLYESFFDPKTGNIVRQTEDTEEVESTAEYTSRRDLLPYEVTEALRKKYPHRYNEFPSPSPETVDISITNRCDFGCPYCYQDSKPRIKHGSRDLVATVLKGFETVPYQIAIGGGEPTLHPDLPAILREARELGTVPNFTTNGQKLSSEVIKATNDVCGGVAMTYHTHKGFDWFRKHYKQLREALTCQVNVHLIADAHIVEGIKDLIRLQDEMNRVINLVLLAYDPAMGRAKLDRVMRRTTYHKILPGVVKRALGQGMMIAFGEGLLPYFLSRPEIGINTSFAIPAEGRFSCYVNSAGWMTGSSFQHIWDKGETVFETPSQTLWDNLYVHGNYKGGEACDDGCPYAMRCSTPNDFSYFICARAPHNKLLLESPPDPEPERTSLMDRLLED